jgi:hypothetical protein
MPHHTDPSSSDEFPNGTGSNAESGTPTVQRPGRRASSILRRPPLGDPLPLLTLSYQWTRLAPGSRQMRALRRRVRGRTTLAAVTPQERTLRLYGTPSDQDPLAWSWVEEQLEAAGTYWLVAPTTGHPHPRPVWGIWHGQRLHLSGPRR